MYWPSVHNAMGEILFSRLLFQTDSCLVRQSCYKKIKVFFLRFRDFSFFYPYFMAIYLLLYNSIRQFDYIWFFRVSVFMDDVILVYDMYRHEQMYINGQFIHLFLCFLGATDRWWVTTIFLSNYDWSICYA